MLRALERKGYIERRFKTARGMVVLRAPTQDLAIPTMSKLHELEGLLARIERAESIDEAADLSRQAMAILRHSPHTLDRTRLFARKLKTLIGVCRQPVPHLDERLDELEQLWSGIELAQQRELRSEFFKMFEHRKVPGPVTKLSIFLG
jgi:hypothetical protein